LIQEETPVVSWEYSKQLGMRVYLQGDSGFMETLKDGSLDEELNILFTLDHVFRRKSNEIEEVDFQRCTFLTEKHSSQLNILSSAQLEVRALICKYFCCSGE
jgi:hypothetical protein